MGQSPFTLGEVIDAADDTLVADEQAQMHGKASGADVAWSYWHVIRYRDAGWSRSEWFTDRAEALEAAELSE